VGHKPDILNAFLQKINHFAGMLELCRKKTLARSITAMAALFPGHYQFCPKTYVLPEDLQTLWKDLKSPKKGKPKTLILKPDSGSQVHAAQRTVMLKPDSGSQVHADQRTVMLKPDRGSQVHAAQRTVMLKLDSGSQVHAAQRTVMLKPDSGSQVHAAQRTVMLKPDSGSQVHAAQRTVIMKPAWAVKCTMLVCVTQAAQ